MYFEKVKNININEKCCYCKGVSWKGDRKNTDFLWCWRFFVKNIRYFLKFLQNIIFYEKRLKKHEKQKMFYAAELQKCAKKSLFDEKR